MEFLTKSLQRGWISTDGYRLEFFTPTGDPHQLYVASATLYAELDQPRPIGAIGGRVFAAWMERPIVQPLRAALHLDSQALVRLGEQVFSVLRIRAEKVRLAPSAALVALSILAQDKPVEVRWGLETAGGTNDVTAAILQKLRCETAGEPRITQVQGFANEAAAAVGRVQWSCGEGSYSGRLTIRLPSDGAPLEVTTGSFKALRSCGENLAIPQ